MTTSSFSTRLRTWLLMGILSSLLVGVGFFIGGNMYFFLGMALVMNLGAYFFSDKIALAASRAKPVTQAEAPQLYADVLELTQRADLPMPRLYLIPQQQPNAFATGRNAKHAAVAVTAGLLELMPRDQVKGVLAHELAHVKNRDILVASIAAMIASVLSWVGFAAMFGGRGNDNPLGAIGSLLAIIVVPIAGSMVQLAISRQREYLADATGAQILGRAAPLADALETLDRGTKAIPMDVNPATSSLYIANPFRGGGMTALMSTHPPMQERIARLRAMDRV